MNMSRGLILFKSLASIFNFFEVKLMAENTAKLAMPGLLFD